MTPSVPVSATEHIQRDLLASCWTWAGDAGPGAWSDEHCPVPLADRISAVAASRWRGVGLSHTDIVEYRDNPGLPALRSQLRDAGVERVELEFLTDWWATGPQRKDADRVRDDLLDAADLLGVDTIKAGAAPVRMPGQVAPEPSAFAAEFARLADRADQFGVSIALEAMSHTNLATFPAAVDFVRTVGHPRGGLAVDVCQLAKSGDTDYSLLPALLRDVPVYVVELGDALVDTARLADAAADHGVGARCLPGRGDIDVPGFVAAVWRSGWRGWWGVEIISADLRRLPVAEGVRAVREGIEPVLDAAERLLHTSD